MPQFGGPEKKIRHLTRQKVADCHRDGFAYPVQVLTSQQAAHYRQCLEDYEKQARTPLRGNMRHKTHLLFKWADPRMYDPAILAAIGAVIGRDILSWSINFFIKASCDQLGS